MNWWRVCLDEAQMVSTVITKPSKLVAKLSSVHRWAVTGTPIQKSFDDLFGLISFLCCSPYNERDKWIEKMNKFHSNFMDLKPILSVFEPIMWRTCKSKAIMEQINIPEQTELVHFMKMSDLEHFYYNCEHKKCWDDFYDKTRQVGINRRLTTLNPHILKIVRLIYCIFLI